MRLLLPENELVILKSGLVDKELLINNKQNEYLTIFDKKVDEIFSFYSVFGFLFEFFCESSRLDYVSKL